MLRYLALICFFGPFVSSWDFSPVKLRADVYTPIVPVEFAVSQTQILNGSIFGSYWSSSFLTDTNGHQYMVLFHFNTAQMIYFRGSILNISGLSHTSFTYFLPGIPDVPSNKEFYINFDNCTLEALTTDTVSKLRIMSTYADSTSNSTVGLNLTWTADHPILYNMGTGTFPFGPGHTNEWGMPSGRTEGSLLLDKNEVHMDPGRSFTWYDRQWGDSAPVTGNWTWYELHLPNDVKASVWTWDNAFPPQNVRFATILYPNGQTRIVPVDWNPNYSKTWTSPESGIVYPQEWDLKFLGGPKEGGIMKIMSILGPQEIMAGKGVPISVPSYEGFVTITGTFENEILDGKAFGLVEMERFVM